MVLSTSLTIVSVLLVLSGLRTIGVAPRCRSCLGLLKLLLLSLLGELGEQFEEGEQELTLLRSQVIAQLPKLVHVLFAFFVLLVACKLDLVYAFEHVSLALLSCLKLADVQRAAAEGTL